MKERPLIYIPDATYDNSDYYPGLSERESSIRFLAETQEHFKLTASRANIGAGADWPAFALEALEYIQDREVVIASLAVFFSGKKINENLDAWLSIGRKLSSSIQNTTSLLNRSASALVGIFKMSENYETNIEELQLYQYLPIDEFDADKVTHLRPVRDNQIRSEISEEYLGGTTHYFRIRINEDEFEVLARRITVLVRKVEEKQ